MGVKTSFNFTGCRAHTCGSWCNSHPPSRSFPIPLWKKASSISCKSTFGTELHKWGEEAGNSPSMDYLSRISSVGFKGQRNWWWEMAARSNLVRNKDETVVNDVCLKDNHNSHYSSLKFKKKFPLQQCIISI